LNAESSYVCRIGFSIEPISSVRAIRDYSNICNLSNGASGDIECKRGNSPRRIKRNLSGIATLTATYVEAVAGTKAAILDTRKTTPGLRLLEKYAVACGGGQNHRIGLFDAVLIKDNHIAVAGGVGEAVRRARAYAGHMTKVEVEVETLDQLAEAMAAGPDVVMFDNMSLADMREGVRLVGGRALTEASGNVTVDTVAAIAEAGVDMISSGWITHSAPALDLALDLAIG